jgi:hypothetical protein
MEQKTEDKCFACDKPLNSYNCVDTRDDQVVFVGSECYRKIIASGETGYQPPKGGPRLWRVGVK